MDGLYTPVDDRLVIFHKNKNNEWIIFMLLRNIKRIFSSINQKITDQVVIDPNLFN